MNDGLSRISVWRVNGFTHPRHRTSARLRSGIARFAGSSLSSPQVLKAVNRVLVFLTWMSFPSLDDLLECLKRLTSDYLPMISAIESNGSAVNLTSSSFDRGNTVPPLILDQPLLNKN
jgi:hypothetical protein